MNATDHRHADSPSRRPRLRCWGWGAEGEDLAPEELQAVEKAAARRADPGFQLVPVPQLEEYQLQPSRVAAPDALADALSDSPYDRLTHCCGQSFADGVRMLLREPPRPPDLVAFPRDEAQVRQVLDWATDARVAVVPYGCGSSVCGGVESEIGGDYAGVVSLDLQHLWRVLEVDRASRAALIQGGALGPELEAQLRPHGLTLRHFPQSFEYSTLGGWIATRSGGHYASLYTHIDDFVEALQVVTPQGEVQTRRLPGSGAGPLARPHVHRLGGHPWRDHPGLDAGAGPPLVPRQRLGAVRRHGGRHRGHPADHPGGAVPVQLPGAGPGRGARQRRDRGRRGRC